MDTTPFEDLDLELCGLITLVGQSNSGKTTLLRSIIDKLMGKGLFKTWVNSSTADIYRHTDYDFALPQNVRKISMDSIERVITLQEQLIVRSATDKRINPKWICIVLDDFIGTTNSNLARKGTEIISRLAVSGRHYKTCLILLTQHLNKAPPVVRNQSSYVFITKTTMATIKEAIFQMQTTYTNKNQLWDLYKRHSTSKRYASTLIQTLDPYDKNIYWVEPAKPVQFIKDSDSAEIIAEAEYLDGLSKLENQKPDNSDSSDSQGTLHDDL